MTQKQNKGWRAPFYLLAILLVSGMSVAVAQTDKVKQRSEIDPKYTWDLSSLFTSEEEWEKSLAFVKDNMGVMENYKGRLGESASTLLEALKTRDSIGILMDNLYVYAYLRADEDNRVSKYQELGDRASSVNSQWANITAYIEPELLTLDPQKIETFVKEQPALQVYKFYLDDVQRARAHILSEQEEALLALASPAINASARTFNLIENADVTFGTVKDENGQEVELTRERYSRMLESQDRRVRKDASDTYNQAWLKYINGLSGTLSGSVKKDYFLMQARKYNSCLEMALDDDNIPVDVFQNLIKAANNNLAPLHKWAGLRKRLLGVDTLYTYDLSVPLTKETPKTYTFEEAQKVVLEGLQPLGKQYLADLKKGFESRWIDAFETQGKGSGAYHWGTYTSHPHVLLNYNGTLEHVFTLAHEMGHAMHSYYTNKHEPYIYGGHYIFTAEVASTCNEAVLMKYMLEKAKSKEEKMALLNYYIEQIIGTFYTQLMFSEFEIAVHKQMETGGALSVDFFRQTYRDIYQKYWGPELVIGEINDLGGMRISHFYRQFYVFQYATCYAAAQVISQRIQNKERGALEDYFRFLSTGSSMYPVDVLKQAGVDMTTEEPVSRTIKLFASLVDEMERLLNDKS